MRLGGQDSEMARDLQEVGRTGDLAPRAAQKGSRPGHAARPLVMQALAGGKRRAAIRPEAGTSREG
jgi:hypothetical protein